jgi:hypothetical protein
VVFVRLRSGTNYFTLKLAESVQGWKSKWLYVAEKKSKRQKNLLPPFKAGVNVPKIRSWDEENTQDEEAQIKHLVDKIQQLQTKPGRDLSGVQLIAHFLRIRIAPLQARARGMWTYTGTNDSDRIGPDVSTAEFDALVRHLTKLMKKNLVPDKCLITPYGNDHALSAVSFVFACHFFRLAHADLDFLITFRLTVFSAEARDHNGVSSPARGGECRGGFTAYAWDRLMLGPFGRRRVRKWEMR